MKKVVLVVFCSILVAFSTAYAQPTISCPGVDAGNDTTLGCGGCVNLTAVPVSGFAPTTYNVQTIPYNPYSFNTGAPIIINIDDAWGPQTALPFNFCFYGNTYNTAQPGSNGMVSFDLFPQGSYCPWPISAAIPSPTNPLNCIMGPWHDINPSFGGAVYAQMYGTAPCRVYVVSWLQNAMFSCTSLFTTQQIAIYETTNIVEVYIQSKPLCSTWNSGASILGVHNNNGTQAVAVPGHNYPTQWSANNEAWRWTPAGASTLTNVAWYEVGNPVAISNALTATACPTANTSYYAEITYTNCDGSTVLVRDTLNVGFTPGFSLNPTVNDVNCPGGANGSASITITGGTPPFSYLWSTGATTSSISNLAAGVYTVTVTDGVGCQVIESYTITQPNAFSYANTSTNSLCFGGTTGTASAVITGGTPGYSYSWSPSGQTSQTASGLAAGLYNVTVTDANGCTSQSNVTVGQNTAVVPSLSMVPSPCFGTAGGEASATASGGTPGYTYSWSNGQTTPTATGYPAGAATVTVTDVNGCTAISTIQVTQPSQMSALVTSVNVSCNGGSNGSATVIPSGGTPGYTYAWSPSGGTGATASNLSAGAYTVTVTDANGCTITRNVTILQPNQNTVIAYATPESCTGSCNGTVAAVPGGGTAPYAYLWSNGATTNAQVNLCAGNYSVTVTDAQGCVISGSTTVGSNPNPVANAGPDMSFCEGTGGIALQGTASGGGGAPYYYTWTCNTPPCGLSCVSCPNPVANPTDTTVYYLMVTDQNGCQSPLDSMIVNVLPKPIVDAGPDTAICATPAPCVVLTPSISNGYGPYTYQWIPGTGLNNATIANPCARPDTSTIYALVVTDLSTGCTSDFTTTDTLSTVEVVVNPLPVADAGPDRIICDGDSTQLQGIASNAGPQYEFQWSPTLGLSSYAQASPFAFPTLTTTYSLVVWSNGCPSIADNVTVFVTEIPTVDAGQNRDICAGDSAFLDGNASIANQVIPDSIVSYTWSPAAGLSATNVPDVMASPAQTGLYYLTVSTAQGCTNLDSVLVTINPSPLLDAGPNMTVCAGSGPWDLNGSIAWVNGVSPGDLQNIIIDWQPAQYVIGANNTEDVQINPDQTMYFYFTVTYNTCTTTDSLLVTVVNQIVPVVTADTATICQGQSVGLHVTGGLGGSTISWTPSASLDNATSADPIASPNATTTYHVTLSESGCFGSDSITINVIETPKVEFVSSFNDGCAPVEVNFTSLTADGILLTWDFGDDSPRENGSPITHTFSEPGSYPVMLYGTNTGGCADSSNVAMTVVVHDTVVAAFHSDPNYPVELTIPGSAVNFVDDTQGSSAWMWDFGTGYQSPEENPTYTFSAPGTYFVTLTVRNEWGCVGTVSHGPYIVKVPDLFIPNVFSPNADGINDEFVIQYTGDQPFTCSVYDRWGVKQWSSTNKTGGWNGENDNGPVPDGVFYYTLRIGDREFNGNITLVR